MSSKKVTVVEVDGVEAIFDGVRWRSSNKHLVESGKTTMALHPDSPSIPDYRHFIAKELADFWGGRIVSHDEPDTNSDPNTIY